ncbi:hypothetical protein AX14_011910, partial [Amanita brunnescens Koide BX004]
TCTTYPTTICLDAEEEKFVINQVRDEACVRCELLGDDGQARRSQNNNWVIQPWKKVSVPVIDIDSDTTADDDNDDGDKDEADGNEETDEWGVGAGYVGLTTGWSEDDESSFDVDLSFANLLASDVTTHGLQHYEYLICRTGMLTFTSLLIVL